MDPLPFLSLLTVAQMHRILAKSSFAGIAQCFQRALFLPLWKHITFCLTLYSAFSSLLDNKLFESRIPVMFIFLFHTNLAHNQCFIFNALIRLGQVTDASGPQPAAEATVGWHFHWLSCWGPRLYFARSGVLRLLIIPFLHTFCFCLPLQRKCFDLKI